MMSIKRNRTLLCCLCLVASAISLPPVHSLRSITKLQPLTKKRSLTNKKTIGEDNNIIINSKNAVTTGASHLAVSLRGGGRNDDFVDDAFAWVCNLGAPAALVAGAVIATLYESMAEGSLDVEKADKAWVRLAKKVTRLLLLTAFIFEVICIFCTTILGTVLLSRPAVPVPAISALDYLRSNFEFEYLTARICFTQGLLNWLAAIGIEHAIPQGDHETEARRNMDILIASSLATLIIFMIQFSNGHMTFYHNCYDMILRYTKLVMLRFVWRWPPRAMSILAVPPFLTALLYFYKVFFDFEVMKKKSK